MSPILAATSLLPTGMTFDMVVDMFVGGFTELWCLFTVGGNLDGSGATEILKPQDVTCLLVSFKEVITVRVIFGLPPCEFGISTIHFISLLRYLNIE